MVMFKEDEDRIRAMERAAREAKRGPVMRWARRLVKIALITGILLFIGLTILMRMAEESAYLQKGVIDYMQQATAMEVEVGTFGDIKIFPVIMLGTEDVRMARPGQDNIEISIGQFKYAAGFWDTMFSRDRVKVMSLRDATFSASALKGERPLYIEYAGVSPHAYNGNAPGFSMKGRWGDEAFEAMIAMDLRENNGRIENYIMRKTSPFHARLGGLEIDGELRTSMLSGIWLTIHSLSDTAYPLTIAGTVNYGKKWGAYYLDFDIKAAESRLAEISRLEGNFSFRPEAVKGDITGLSLQAENMKTLIALIMRIAGIVIPGIAAQEQPPHDNTTDITITYNIDTITAQDHDLGAVKGVVRNVDANLRNVLDCIAESIMQHVAQKPDADSAVIAAIQADHNCAQVLAQSAGSDAKDKQE